MSDPCVFCGGAGCLLCSPPPVRERWLPVVGFEDSYEVSDLGRVRSRQRVVMRSDGTPNTVRERILALWRDKQHGYLWVGLRQQGKRQKFAVHRLVLEAFVGPCPPDFVCCHWDDDPLNNRLDNLRWDTRSANGLDQVRNGRHANARKSHCRQGHEFSPDSTKISAKGARQCRACSRAHTDKYRAARPINTHKEG